ncbi:MAG: 1,4-alpha-glucan branching protein GlgB [Acidobacteria bacterium]|nr:1,4-alpha-glucan branching protein GlgB [Acidobacteriota bacterium]
MTISAEIDHLVRGEHGEPFRILGPHSSQRAGVKGTRIRALLPQAQQAEVLPEGELACPMTQVHPDGLFEAFLPERPRDFAYQLRMTDWQGRVQTLQDPYRFPPLLSNFDLHLLGEGTHLQLHEKLGAHLVQVDGIGGVRFAVWAPNAIRVSVVGRFNEWDGRRHPMRRRGESGIWELFLPEIGEGEAYKYEVLSRSDPPLQLKADPCGFHAEMRPRTASIVFNLNRYQWQDSQWMAERARRDLLQAPLSVYEVHLGSWKRVPEEDNRFLTYRELAHELVPEVKELGFTHIELLPVMEHPFDASWGYQTIGYFAPTSRFGTPEDFMYFVDYCHQNGIGVILDWVPGHFPNDWHGLMQFDGTCLYEHADPRQGQHPDWGTLVFNYGRNEVRNFLLSNALYWLEKYHADGLRVDGVASMLYLNYSRQEGEWIPNQYGGNENLEAIEFLKTFNVLAHEKPGVFTLAEESTAWPGVSRPVHLGGLGFTMKWNMGWMHDMLDYMSKDPIHRKHHHNNLTFVLLYAFHENFVLPLSHDEVVHGKRSLLDKMPGSLSQRFSNLRLLYGYMYGQPGKKLLFMGGEFGQWREWNCEQSLDWHLLEYEPHRQLRRFVQDLNHLYRSQPALYAVDFEHSGFEWIDFRDWEQSTVAFLRRASNPQDFLVFVCNFTPVPRFEYRVGVPESGYYRELLNSDAAIYGGNNLGNSGGDLAEPIPWHGRPYSLCLTLPPLSVLVLRRE